MASRAAADVQLPHIFSDHMVLQQKQPIPVWGSAEPGEEVAVSLDGKTIKTKGDDKGRWMVRLPAREAKPGQKALTLMVEGKNKLAFTDVLVGEVWICSGQSNMQMAVAQCNNAAAEIAAAKFPEIRFFSVPNITAPFPKEDCEGGWSVCAPDTVGGFSGVGFFFGRHVHETLKVPVGLINTSWGGTIAEAWTSGPALRAKHPEFNAALDEVESTSDAAKDAAAAYKAKMEKYDQARKAAYAMEDDLEGAAKLAAPDLDDSGWKTMALPANWKAKELPDVDGLVRFRKTIDIPAAWAGKEIILWTGPIDEVDNTWFNGALVGGKGKFRTNDTSFWSVPREYHVPGKLVKPGPNVVAVRVYNAVGAGGLCGAPAETMFAELADGSDKTHIPLAGDWRYNVELALPPLPPNANAPNSPSLLFNSMIHPLIPYGIRGAIWYQGESNIGRDKQYRTLLPTLVADWRTRWGEGDFPFLVVQLANHTPRNPAPEESGWAALREAQAMAVATMPNAGLAVSIDIGDAADIHPKNKQDVGIRLGLAARAIAYKEEVAFHGPTFKAMAVKEGKARLTFTHVDKGLVMKGDALKGFAVCGADKKFVWAQARVEGDEVVLSSEQVPEPTAVRYNWASNPEGNLYNGEGLPAVPFRTDVD
ncbi:MAG: 9-O-acetylesterase [Planctomycetota bacterium]|nr:9-O-acetylesterase [Planctomycetota bacterium]